MFRRLRAGWPILLITAAALALRIWGIGWSLPNQDHLFSYHPDEGVNLIGGVLLPDTSLQPRLDIGFYPYGTLYFYLWQGAALVNTAVPVVRLPRPGEPSSSTPYSFAAMILVGRLVSAVLGALTVLLVWATGRRMFDERAALLAAAFCALAPLAVVHAHFATVDVTATFFVSLALFATVRLLEYPGPRAALLAGAACGLAGASKYNAILVAAAPLTAALLKHPQQSGQRFRTVLTVIAGAATGFLIACPGVFLNWPQFSHDLTFELRKSREGMGNLFAQTGAGWVYHLIYSLRYGLGIPLLLLGLCGIAQAVWRRRPADLCLLAFIAVYYLVIGAAQVRFMRYVIPLFPALGLLSGRLLADLLEPKDRRLIGWAVVASVGGYTLLLALALDRLMVVPDSRDVALAYIRKNVKPNQLVALARTPWYDMPPLAPDFTAINPARRWQAAHELTQFTLRVPPEGEELGPGFLLPPLPSWALTSDLETEDWQRLRFPPWLSAEETLNRAFSPHVFENRPSILGLSFGKPDYVPNDLLYIYPRVTLYENRQRIP